MLKLTPIPLLLLAVACADDTTGPELVHFEFFRDQTFEYDAEVRQIDWLEIEGTIRTPCLPYEVHAAVHVGGDELTLEVIGRDEDGCPQDAIGALGYRATIQDLDHGLWRVRIVHRWEDADWPVEEPFTTDVVI